MMIRHKSAPCVSVLMTVFRPDPRFFTQAVESILTQTFRDFEFVVVEDPSTHLGRDMLSRGQLSRMRYHVNPARTSLVCQKNFGLQHCRGQYVAVMDCDDVAHPERFSQQVEYLETNPAVDVLGSQIAIIDERDRLCSFRLFPTEHREIVDALMRSVPFCHPSVMMRRKSLVRVGGYREFGFQTAEDYELWSRMFFAGAVFANLPHVLLSYRVHSRQMKRTHMRDTIRAVLYVKRWYWRRHMNSATRTRMLVEQLLAYFPEQLVYRMTLTALYRICATGPGMLFSRRPATQTLVSTR